MRIMSFFCQCGVDFCLVISARFEREDSDMRCFNLATFRIEYPRGGRWRNVAIMICNIAHMQER